MYLPRFWIHILRLSLKVSRSVVTRHHEWKSEIERILYERSNQRPAPDFKTAVQRQDWWPISVTDLRIAQIRHGLGPRATLSYDGSMLTRNLQNCAKA